MIATAPERTAPDTRRRGAVAVARWCGLLTLSLAGWWLFDRIGLAAPELFAALLAAIVLALTGVGPARPARPVGMAAQGTLAVSIGMSVRPDMVSQLGAQWLPIVTVAAATLLLSVGAGALLACHRLVDPVTGVLSMLAGGATGLVAVADELGGDEKVVVISQYLRVALVVLTMPLAVTYLFAADVTARVAPTDPDAAPWWIGALFAAAAIAAGTGAASLLRIPIPATLGPLALTAAVELAGWVPHVAMPAAMLPAAFLIIGWQAGLSFTRAGLLALGRIALWAVSLIALLCAVCAGLGVLLSAWTGASLMEGYLATTPGGLAAVLAVASATDSDVTLVATSQVLRLLMMLASAPVVVWLAARWASRSRYLDRRHRRQRASAARPKIGRIRS
jgi:uncharacterized protein